MGQRPKYYRRARSADGHFDWLPALTAELIGLNVNLIVALSAPETAAAKKVAETIPIVFVVHGDPIGTGDIQSLTRPGGHITGLSQMHPELSTKQLDLLKQLAPGVSRVGVLWNAANPAKTADWRELDPAARTLGVSLQSFEVRAPEDFEGAFVAVREQRPDGLLTLGDPLTVTMRTSLADFARKSASQHSSPTGNSSKSAGSRPMARTFPASGMVCGQDPQGRQRGRPACPAAHEIRAVPEPCDCQSSTPGGPAILTADRRSGHRARRVCLAPTR